MYLDRPIREAELLQAIARVNRTGFGKRCGIVVDYYGVAQHLKEALAAYADEDMEGALASLKDEVPVLRDRHLRVVDLFRSGASSRWMTPKPASRPWAARSCVPSSPSSSRPSWRRWIRCCRAPRAAVFGRREAAGLHLRPGAQPLQGHAGSGQGRRRQGAQADRRPRDLAGHRPEDSADPADRCRVRHAPCTGRQRPRQGIGDGARDSLAHPQAHRRRPGAVPQALGAAERHP
jgi:hypothetical protein